ncbi:MAG: HAMP domain-containing protein [Caldilineales bacterium]|nr:HAMP domain-containing protein [Caldilineales bacterium]
MRKSLWLKLMGIFALIIVVGVVVIILVVNLAVSTQFERLVHSGDLLQAQKLAGVLANFYAQQGDWSGVQDILVSQALPDIEHEPGHGMMMGGVSADEMVDMMRVSGMGVDRVALADVDGVVVADTAGEQIGQRHPGEHLSMGQPVEVNGERVGTVLVGSMIEPALNPLDADFLSSVNLAVFLAAIAVGALALLLGSLLFRQITRPVTEVTAAAEALAAGDLGRRVPVRSDDEVGRLGDAFNHMADSLARQEVLRRNMVGDIAHELRTPLSLMQGNLEAMLDGYYELSPQNIEQLHQDTLMMARLVDDLRVLSLAEAGQLTLEREIVNVGELALRASESFKGQASEKDVTLTIEIEPNLPTISGDEQRLTQVLVNLLANALRHTPGGGTISVQCSVSSDQLGGWVQVAVSDTGEGIPTEDLSNLFERFYRTDKSRTRASGGTGLGLAIAKQLVEAHGGRIWAESEGMGKGSAFALELPVSAQQNSAYRG